MKTPAKELSTLTAVGWAVAAAAAPSPLAFADKAPLPVAELQRRADAVVVATIEGIRVQPERSQFEPAVGNSDWGIYLTLRVESVDQGNVTSERLEAQCFRIRFRTSGVGYLTPGGHRPIPQTGTRVQAYLEHEAGGWRVLLPNGIVPLAGSAEDAPEVAQLRSRKYTWLLPLELWDLLAVVSVSAALFRRLLSGRRSKRPASD